LRFPADASYRRSVTELRHLRYFVAVAEERHFGRAAARLHISQPPLSRQIQELERELGVELLDRSRRSAQLTPAGASFYVDARAVLRSVDEAAQRARALAIGQRGSITVAFSETTAASGLLREALMRFHQRLPQVDVTLEELTAGGQAAGLRGGHVSVSLGYRLPPLQDTSIQHRRMFEDRLQLALPEGDPLATAATLDVAELSRRTLLFLPRAAAPEFHSQVMGRLAQHGIRPESVREVRLLRSVYTLISCGLGFGLAPQSTTRSSPPGVLFRPLPADVRITTHLFHRAETNDPLVRTFVEAAHEASLTLRSPRARSAPLEEEPHGA
jgi:DNA-binding transcriptional LysR family regulator